MASRREQFKQIGKFPIAIFSIIIIVLTSIFYLHITPDALEDIIRSKELRVATRSGPTTYFIDSGEEQGFEYELAGEFANFLGVELNIQRVDKLDDILKKTSLGGFHLAAAGLAKTQQREEYLAFSESYYSVETLVIYRTGEQRPLKAEDLENKTIAVVKNSFHIEILNTLKQTYPNLQWVELPNQDIVDLLEMVRDFHFDYAIVNSNEFRVNQQLFPRLNDAMTLGEPHYLAWATMKGKPADALQAKISEFFQLIRTSGRLELLIQKYFGNLSDISRGSATAFTRNVAKVLPNYIELIKKVALEEGIDWQLLAAISYQESHWNPDAVSPTGVKGMMMLTLATMNELGLDSRVDAEQSLRGGARYFLTLRERLPERITEPDRSNLALAAYNVGRGHLEDARVITQRQGKNPDKWEDVSLHLPLLQKKRWFSNTKYGYARGQEPVDYVYNIRHYESYLRWREINIIQKNSIETEQENGLETMIPDILNKGLDAL